MIRSQACNFSKTLNYSLISKLLSIKPSQQNELACYKFSFFVSFHKLSDVVGKQRGFLCKQEILTIDISNVFIFPVMSKFMK